METKEFHQHSSNKNILKCAEVNYDLNIPKVPFSRYILNEIRKEGNNIAIVNTETKQQTTFSELISSVSSLAAALQHDIGLKKGEFVAVALPNSAEFIITVLAISECGGVVSLVNPAYNSRELHHVAETIKPDLWICKSDFIRTLATLQQSGVCTRAITVGDAGHSDWHALIKSSRPELFRSPPFNVFEDLATLPFSSGTTGLPKGVMLSHHNIVAGLCQFKVWCPYTDEDTNLCVLPMFHQYGCMLGLTSIATGAKLVIVPKFSFTAMLEAIQNYKVTMVPAVPPLLLLLARHPATRGYNLSTMKACISSAAPLSLSIIDEITTKYGCEVIEGYGLTEATLATHFTPRNQRKPGSIGKLMPFFEAKILDTNSGEALGPRREGEICVRGPMVMKGYRGNASATSTMIDSEGWMHTGDVGYYDEEGWFFIVDRIKELIKYKGMQVAPSELEHLLLSHPGVADAAVIGVPDELAGELPRAYVVKRPDSQVNEEDIMNFIDGQVAHFKRLRGGVTFVAAIPKLMSGKILRRELKAVASKL